MNFSKLYVIGNGFDLHHEMQTKLHDYKDFVEEHNSEVIKAVENYLPTKEDWSDLEASLAHIYSDNMIEDFEHYATSYGSEDWSDSAHHDFQYEVDRLVKRLSVELTQQLRPWVSRVQLPTIRLLKTIDSKASFLNFNYTSTIEALYSVPDSNVLHIHGKAESPSDELVLGHAWNPKDRSPRNARYDMDQIDTRLMETSDIIDKYFSKTFKQSSLLVQRYRSFFEQLANVKNVFVLGHSLSEVDRVYFDKLLTVLPASCRWHIACRTESEETVKVGLLKQFGVPPGDIVACSWSDM